LSDLAFRPACKLTSGVGPGFARPPPPPRGFHALSRLPLTMRKASPRSALHLPAASSSIVPKFRGSQFPPPYCPRHFQIQRILPERLFLRIILTEIFRNSSVLPKEIEPIPFTPRVRSSLGLEPSSDEHPTTPRLPANDSILFP